MLPCAPWERLQAPAEGETPVAWANFTSRAVPKVCVALYGSEPGHLAYHRLPLFPVSPQGSCTDT